MLDGKVAIVTSASKGIGAAIAIGLGEAGASVVVNYASSRDWAERTVEAIRSHGGNAVAVSGDVSKASEVARLFAEADAAFAALDILVNNAAVYPFGPLESVTQEEFRRHFDTNVLGVYLNIKEAVNRLSARRARGSRGQTGALHLDEGGCGHHNEDARKGIRATPNSREFLEPRRDGYRRCEKRRNHGQPPNPRDNSCDAPGAVRRTTRHGPVAVFLASDASHWITGELIHVTGGS